MTCSFNAWARTKQSLHDANAYVSGDERILKVTRDDQWNRVKSKEVYKLWMGDNTAKWCLDPRYDDIFFTDPDISNGTAHMTALQAMLEIFGSGITSRMRRLTIELTNHSIRMFEPGFWDPCYIRAYGALEHSILLSAQILSDAKIGAGLQGFGA